LFEYRDVYAGGRLVGSGSTDVITIVNPATEEVTGAVPSIVERDVEVAVAAARQAFDSGGWPLLSAAERAAALDRLAAALEARAEDTARLVTAEMGMPITLSRALQRVRAVRDHQVLRFAGPLADCGGGPGGDQLQRADRGPARAGRLPGHQVRFPARGVLRRLIDCGAWLRSPFTVVLG
jgi:hypothetical protein